MSGKLIINTPNYVMLGMKYHVYLDNTEVAQLKRAEKKEIEINRTCLLRIRFFGVDEKSVPIEIPDGKITEIVFKIETPAQRVIFTVVRQEDISSADSREEKAVYEMEGVRGKHLKVYEDKCIITTKVTVGSILTHNATDGEKTIYFADCIGVQLKKTGATIGYLQLETASSSMNNRTDNYWNENSFTFNGDPLFDYKMEEIANYIRKRIEEFKRISRTPTIVTSTVSAADELKKFKELLDMGIITQEEFDAKKKQLLGL